jgi:hypothetical protein
MNALAMWAGKASAFSWRIIPQSGVDYFTNGGQFRRRWATNEKTTRGAFRFSRCRWLEVKAH